MGIGHLNPNSFVKPAAGLCVTAFGSTEAALGSTAAEFRSTTVSGYAEDGSKGILVQENKIIDAAAGKRSRVVATSNVSALNGSGAQGNTQNTFAAAGDSKGFHSHSTDLRTPFGVLNHNAGDLRPTYAAATAMAHSVETGENIPATYYAAVAKVKQPVSKALIPSKLNPSLSFEGEQLEGILERERILS